MSSTLTTFGRITRTFRAERGEFLKDMAQHLGVTPAYLSAVERGQRNAPLEWVGVLQKAYDLSFESAESLRNAVLESRTYRKLDISHLPLRDKRLFEMFAELYPSFDESERDQLQKMIDRRKGCRMKHIKSSH